MSFSTEIKSELFGVVSQARHCRAAELSALISGSAKIDVDKKGHLHIKLQTESGYVAKKVNLLINRLLNIRLSVSVRFLSHSSARKKGVSLYTILISGDKEVNALLLLCKLRPLTDRGELVPKSVVYQNTCCKRAFLRGAFLYAGSVSNPQKSYHFEISEQEKVRAEQLKELIRSFGVDAKLVVRKSYHVVYVKEGAQVSELLTIMEARIAMMKFENERIIRDVRNSVNRQVNCETANLEKTANAARRQYEDIILIRDKQSLSVLPDHLQEIANLRLEHPEASLSELGNMLFEKLGKSGVNHRLQKISEYADSLRGK